jgi:hypothetical protein
MMIPVPQSGTLRGIRGQNDAARVSGVEAVLLTIAPGQVVTAWPEGSRYLGFIFSHGDTPALAEAALRAAHAKLGFTID